nr:PREDICTED: adenosine receptor A3-like [Latimeria chalumnae]|eukprot:XP_005987749.2 PREDICTED: adenosine receptor A3-like [Latimeria chalumnae]
MDALDISYIVIETVIAMASVLGNVLVIWAVKLNLTLRDTTFFFIVSLAVADVAVGCVTIPLAVIMTLKIQMDFYVCLSFACILIILTQCSILSLLAIAIDRYLRVKIPARYKIVVTQKRAWMAVLLCWLLSIIIGLVPMFGWNNRGNKTVQEEERNSSYGHITCQFTSVISFSYLVYFNFFAWVLLPLLLMVFLYAEIFYIIRRQLNQRAATSTESSKYYSKEFKLAKSLALVLFLFAFCWLPLHTMNCVLHFNNNYEISKAALYIGIFMSHSNSAVNPVVYAFKIKKFRGTFLQIWKKYMLCRRRPRRPQRRRRHLYRRERSLM